MTENEKLFVEVAKELQKLLDNKNTTVGMGEVSLRGYFPEALWNKLHFKAGHLSGVMEVEQVEQPKTADVMREIAQEVVTDYLRDEGSWKDYLHDLVSKCVDDVLPASYPNCKPSYDALLKRVEHLEDEGAFQNHVEVALVNIIEASYQTPDNFAAFHRKFAALLKYHLGRIARSQP